MSGNWFKKTTKNLIFILLILCFFSGCGRKTDPTLEDYLQPEPVEKLSLMAFQDKIVISWNYPERKKSKIESFFVERENSGQIKSLGFFDNQTNFIEDRDFNYGEIYKYRLFAISRKGIYSKSVESTIITKKLPEVENLQYKIIDEGVMLSWQAKNSVMYNVYRINQDIKHFTEGEKLKELKEEKIKRGSTDKNFFLDKLNYSAFNPESSSFLIYLVTPYISENSTYIEGKGTKIIIPLDDFIPSKPQEVFWTVNEKGVYISWREVAQKWIKGYIICRKTLKDSDFVIIGQPMIPLFFDVEYNISNLKTPVYYKIFSAGPLKKSEPVEIKVEVFHE